MLSGNLKGEANGNSPPAFNVGLVLVPNKNEMSRGGVFRQKPKRGDDER